MAEKLAAQGPFRAQVGGRPAIVTAHVWEPITITTAEEESRHYARATEIGPDNREVEASATPAADAAAQQLVDRVKWEPWPG